MSMIHRWQWLDVPWGAWLGAGALIAACTNLAFAQVGDKVALGDWALDRTEVTIGQFERYVRATGTVTRAEKEGGGFEYVGGWVRRPGWSWRQPDGVSASADVPAVPLNAAMEAVMLPNADKVEAALRDLLES